MEVSVENVYEDIEQVNKGMVGGWDQPNAMYCVHWALEQKN